MTEKDKMQHPPQKTELNYKATAKVTMEQYRLNYTHLMWVLVPGAFIFAVAYLVIYIQTRAWQLLGQTGLLIVAVTCAAIGYYNLIRREKFDTAGYWPLIGLVIGYGGAEIFFSGMTVYHAIGGILLILLLSSLLLQKKWKSWLIAIASFGAYIWLVNLFEPLPRYNATQIPLLNFVIPGLTGVLVLLSLWQVISLLRFGTIRTRLLIAFATVTLLITASISITWVIMGYQSLQAQQINHLESVAMLKEAEVKDWLSNLEINLSLISSRKNALDNLEIILSPDPAETSAYNTAYKDLAERLNWTIEQTHLFEEIFILDLQGKVIVSTNPVQEGKLYANETYFQQGLEETYIRPPAYALSANKTTVLIALPLLDQEEKTIGVIAGHSNLDTLNEVMTKRTNLGETGEIYLVDSGYGMLTESRFGKKEGYMSTEGVNTAVDEQTNGSGLYEDYRGIPVIGVYHWMPKLQAALLVEQNQTEIFAQISNIALTSLAVAIASILLSLGGSLLITRSIANPLSILVETASQIAAGELEHTAEVIRKDEIGTLAQAFNQMTTQLRELISGLEERVLERTKELEQHSSYLEASAAVSRAATSIINTDQLAQEVVELIQERFDLYYVGLFIVDETNEWAILQAGTGEAGRQMLLEKHRLKIGGESMIGQCVAQSEAHIALDIGEEAVHFDNPYLPETRSEGALPLRSRGQVLGALTVQSVEEAAFDKEAITVLQTMADQIAVALNNAQLLTEANTALEAERRAYGELSHQAWTNMLHSRTDWGYDFENMSLLKAQGNWSNEMRQAEETGKSILSDDETSLAIPIEIRGHVLGVLNFDKDNPEEHWTLEEQALLESLTKELGQALESARLYQDTQRSAAQGRIASEITTHMRETLDIETVLKTAVSDISEALGLAALDVQLGTASNASNKNTLE
ncbi:MAG: hypothetical protein DRI56_01235 [Chloroflexota bacterium]|nr:MAG: hypothetical protein DRI56_01235 [Chloroflexota bacterium]